MTLESSRTGPPPTGETLVEMLYVPLHGSFWLATHPDAEHPRSSDFLDHGPFVFGNGGVARVIESSESESDVSPGDYVAVFGHVPCSRADCYGCRVMHRYTECNYRESQVIGHGGNTRDGTYAERVYLPRYTFEVIYRADDNPSDSDIIPYMFAFLFADVRNALTRNQDTLRAKNMLLFGAGNSGKIATYIFLRSSANSRSLIVDGQSKRLQSLRDFEPERIQTFTISPEALRSLSSGDNTIGFRNKIRVITDQLKQATEGFFGTNNVNLLFDASSGNSAPIWDNDQVLGPNTHVLPFGFGSEYLLISKHLVQMSGLQITMSRGVGNLRNRREVIELIRSGGDDFIRSHLISDSKILNGLDEAQEFISRVYHKKQGHLEADSAIIRLR